MRTASQRGHRRLCHHHGNQPGCTGATARRFVDPRSMGMELLHPSVGRQCPLLHRGCLRGPASAHSMCVAAGATSSGPIIATASHGPWDTWTTQTPTSLPERTGEHHRDVATKRHGDRHSPRDYPGRNLQLDHTGDRRRHTQCQPTSRCPLSLRQRLLARRGRLLGRSQQHIDRLIDRAPGGTATASVPLGLLPFQVVNASGAPVSGATVVITSTSCGADGDQYTLPVTDADGLTQTAVPFGNYSYTVKVGATITSPTTTFTVNANSVSIPETQGPPTVPGIPYYLPGPVQVPSS